ncbi:unnamed protein product [Aspergillus oryzae]|uniref:Unnamed protein product n=2 Tax=Aspergillus oryzae TaxID=5062 RepID=A0AAN5BZB3_ASPOZ|nr:unnamed protein product [Aspergillus oryzae]GMF88627.1 unnamed protein product [Aspergillus oryzae]GMG06782.1 unnamed protein product [Aspergillus oryzae]GMG31388.1 unnamed protein product [Aspergillus oryzae]GMG52397.1 unnamed protein product [Aspergillus oryzae var. brunneus]
MQELFSQVEELRKDLTKAHDEVDNHKELVAMFKDKSNKDKEALEMKNRDHVSQVDDALPASRASLSNMILFRLD